MTGIEQTIDLFLSHSSSDTVWVCNLKSALKRKGFKVWTYHDTGPGESWVAQIGIALPNSSALGVVVTPEALKSPWVHEEYETAIAFRKLVIPILLQNAELPALLRIRRAVDFRKSSFEDALKDLCKALKKPPTPNAKKQSSPNLDPFYRELGRSGRSLLSRGEAEVSPFLEDPGQDRRLGLTLIVRPPPHLAAMFNSVLEKLQRVCPVLFEYDAARYHFTVLSLITAKQGFKLNTVPVEEYQRAIGEALGPIEPFAIEFRGICATKDSIIAQGFPLDSRLEEVRTTLRARLKRAALGPGIDERYKIKGAHVVLARFKRSRSDFSGLLAELRKLRREPLGAMTVRHYQVVVNDYYLSIEKVRILAEFPQPQRTTIPVSPARFVGRVRECDRIVNELTRSRTPVILASGFGGIGKSTLAAEAARRCATLGQGYFQRIVWIDLRQYTRGQLITLDHILNQIADRVEEDSTIPAIPDLQEKKDRVIRLLASYRSLLILDNYESILQQRGQDEEITGFVQMLGADLRGGVRVLFTTRVVSAGLHRLKGHLEVEEMRLEKLSLQDSLNLMKGLAAKRSLALSNSQYKDVWSLLYGLPKYMQLAIDQLAVIPFQEWKKSVATVPTDLHQDEFFGDLFDISWNRILSQQARRLLMAMTFFVGSAEYEALATVAGLPQQQFVKALVEVSSAYLERVSATSYGVHPLTHTVCRHFLERKANASFRNQAAKRFIRHFLKLAKQAKQEANLELLRQELRNVLAASRLASELGELQEVASFGPLLSEFLRIRGYWEELKQVMELVREASQSLGDFDSLARCLVHDMAWLFLRLEDLPKSEQCASEGLAYYRRLDDREGIAQALRHLGKAALLKGEYDPVGGPTSQRHFEHAQQRYIESLLLREELERAGFPQSEWIADMQLDFGRLHWLRGRKHELAARRETPPDQAFLQLSLEYYDRAKLVSLKALHTFRQIDSVRGMAKAHGNIGNAEKEHGRHLSSSGRPQEALQRMQNALTAYRKSLRMAQKIHRKDEIAHARWGLAETLEFFALQLNSAKKRRSTLLQALSHAEESHTLYAALAGPFDQKATRALMERLRECVRTAS